MIHTWIVGRCIVCTGIRLLLLICPFIFLSVQFSNIKFVTLFSRTVRARRLKLGTHMDSGQMYRVYRNQAAAAYSSLYFFIFFLSNFQTFKFFVTLLSGTVRPRRNLVYTWTMCRCIVCTGVRLLLLIHLFISSFFFLSNYQTSKIFVTFFSGTVRPRRLKLGTHVDSGQVYHVYRNPAAAAYSSLYFFIFLSLHLSNIKKFCHIFLKNCEVLKIET